MAELVFPLRLRLIGGSHDVALSASGEALIRLNDSTHHIEFSENGGAWTTLGGGGSGTITGGSNGGSAGQGVYDSTSGANLVFRNVAAASSKIAIALDSGNKNVTVDVTEANLTLSNLGGTLSIAKGGTGQTSAGAALTALGGVSTARTLTAGTGLTGGGDMSADRTISLSVPVSIANGGTNATTASVALSNLGGVPTSRTVTAGTGLTGGGDLSANRTFTNDVVTGISGNATWVGSTTSGNTVLIRANTSGNGKVQIGSSSYWLDEANGTLVLGTTTGAAGSVLRAVANKTIASGTSAVWNGIDIAASTATITGATEIATLTGFNLMSLAVPTITSGSAVVVDYAATLGISGPPVAAGSATINFPYSLMVAQGASRFNNDVLDSNNLIVNCNVGADGEAGISVQRDDTDALRLYGQRTTSGLGAQVYQGNIYGQSLKLAGAPGATPWIYMAPGPWIGFFGSSPIGPQTSGANLSNNVTPGGTTDMIADFTNLTTYATDAATIRNDIYQLARKLKQVNDALRAYGLLT